MPVLGMDFWQFCDAYGNAASVIGLLNALIGFPITWLNQRALRLAAQREVKRISLFVLAGDLNDLDHQLSTVKECCRIGQWLRAYDKCQDARSLILRIAGNQHLEDNERVLLGVGADDLSIIATYLEREKLRAANPPATFHNPKREALDELIVNLGRIRSRLENQTWEVRRAP